MVCTTTHGLDIRHRRRAPNNRQTRPPDGHRSSPLFYHDILLYPPVFGDLVTIAKFTQTTNFLNTFITMHERSMFSNTQEGDAFTILLSQHFPVSFSFSAPVFWFNTARKKKLPEDVDHRYQGTDDAGHPLLSLGIFRRFWIVFYCIGYMKRGGGGAGRRS